MAAFVSFERVFEVLDLKPLIDEPEAPTPMPAGPVSVELERVTFAYPAADKVSLASLEEVATLDTRGGDVVLRDVSLQVEPGQVVALVGSSGSGKSTVASLIPRLYDVDTGHVRVGGVDVRELSFDDLRATIGVVTQDGHLFHDSVRENLRYADPSATDAELWEVLRKVRLDGLIASLADGLGTVVGERGYRFSGGERQRLTIARLLLAKPRVVILDEATASLDSTSEAAVQDALAVALEGRTALVIAHRLSTIRDADLILVLEDGRIVERGTHSELLGPRRPLRRALPDPVRRSRHRPGRRRAGAHLTTSRRAHARCDRRSRRLGGRSSQALGRRRRGQCARRLVGGRSTSDARRAGSAVAVGRENARTARRRLRLPHRPAPAYAERAGVTRFLEVLPRLGHGQWADFFGVADLAGEISIGRPFYPTHSTGQRSQATGSSHHRAGLADERSAAAMRARPAEPLGCMSAVLDGRWQPGRQGRVGGMGDAAIASADDALSYWPFDGSFDELIESCQTVVAETYPAEFYRHFGLPRVVSKRRQASRVAPCARLRQAAEDLGIRLTPALSEQIDGRLRRALMARTRSTPSSASSG